MYIGVYIFTYKYFAVLQAGAVSSCMSQFKSACCMPEWVASCVPNSCFKFKQITISHFSLNAG